MAKKRTPKKFGPMEMLLNIHSVLAFHGASTPEDIETYLNARDIPVTLEQVVDLLRMDAADYFMIHKMIRSNPTSWEVRRAV